MKTTTKVILRQYSPCPGHAQEYKVVGLINRTQPPVDTRVTEAHVNELISQGITVEIKEPK